MRIFWILIVFCYLMSIMAEKYPLASFNVQTHEKQYKSNKYLIGLIFIILILVSGLRSGVGDTYTYKDIFTTIPSNILQYFNSDVITEDKGFYFIVAAIKQFISTDNQIIVFVFSLLTIGFIGYGLYKYSNDMKMSIFLFLTMGCYSTSMNGIRQYFAASILFLLLPLIEKKKPIIYFCSVLLISTIHASAIIFIPLYFLRYCKGWGNISKILLVVGLFLYLTYGTTGPMIANLLGETQYGHYADALISTDKGANFIRILVAFVPVALSWIGKNKINKDMKYGNILINLNILNFITILLANRYWIYARFCIYFNLFSILLLCYCMDELFETRSSKLIKVLCIVCYIIFFWYDSLTSGLWYSSNFIKL